MSAAFHVRAQYGGVFIRSIHDGEATAEAAMDTHRADPSCTAAAKIRVTEVVVDSFGQFTSDDPLLDLPYAWRSPQ